MRKVVSFHSERGKRLRMKRALKRLKIVEAWVKENPSEKLDKRLLSLNWHWREAGRKGWRKGAGEKNLDKAKHMW